MRNGVISVRMPGIRETVRPVTREGAAVSSITQGRERWSPELFAREQIRGLVRQLFFSNATSPARQIIFSPVEQETDVRTICRQVAESLAMETAGTVAVTGEYPSAEPDHFKQSPIAEEGLGESLEEGLPSPETSIHLQNNLWLVAGPADDGRDQTASSLHSYMGSLRSKFEYSVIEGPPAGESMRATAMAQFADGLVLVLSASHTRRATAQKIKSMLESANVRLLGTVLSDRDFPIPERIYRRL